MSDFYVRYHTVQLLTSLLQAREESAAGGRVDAWGCEALG